LEQARRELISLTGSPDGLFSNQKYQIGSILEGLATENLGIFYDHLVYFTAIGNVLHMAIWYIYFAVIWCIFPRFGILDQEKSGNPARKVLN
jgi:hypothetical protein